jgi:hypothetical protein
MVGQFTGESALRTQGHQTAEHGKAVGLRQGGEGVQG